ncbi:gluconate 2-dehydrogenase subunit 3 family protein [Arenibacter palladensis]|uniref:gluconate 2-dehydrogenase subunit 3 family protein n=1 Tax=Arenibacter palladensis TaxID=237373 RepID=UPI002FD5F48C
MNRRNLIKNIGLYTVGLATVPLWINSWEEKSLPQKVGLEISEKEKFILIELVDCIIPATSTPGAKELSIDKFILTMIADCYDKNVQKNFIAGLGELNDTTKKTYNAEFTDLTNGQRAEIFHQLTKKLTAPNTEGNFFPLVRDLTIFGYIKSKYYLLNIVKYEFIPSRFNGSFPLNEVKTS